MPPKRRPRPLTPEQAFGQTLRELREKRRFSQEQLSFASGLHDRHISRLERGLNAPSFKTLLALADALGTTPSKLLRRVEALTGRGGQKP